MDPARSDRNRNRRMVAAAYLLGLLFVGLLFWSRFSRVKTGATSPANGVSPAVASNGAAVRASSLREEPSPGAPAMATSSRSKSNDAPGTIAAGNVAGPTKETQMLRGRAVYRMFCFGCHQWEGQGLPGQVPPLANADFLMANLEESIRGLLVGRSDEIVVNGISYKGIMFPMNYLTDDHIADVMTYARNSWGNSGAVVTAETVARIRRESPPPPPRAEGTALPPKRMQGAEGR